MGIRQPLNADGTMTCRKCDTPKPATTEHYAPSKNTKSGLSATCRECWRVYHQNWKIANKVRTAPRRRELYKVRYREPQAKKARARLEANPLRMRAQLMRDGMRQRSRDRSLPFDTDTLTVPYLMSWIDRTPTCPCCGTTINYGYAGVTGLSNASPSIDRIVPALGYVVGNVALICWRCNNLKRDATADELEVIARWMRSHEAPPECPDH